MNKYLTKIADSASKHHKEPSTDRKVARGVGYGMAGGIAGGYGGMALGALAGLATHKVRNFKSPFRKDKKAIAGLGQLVDDGKKEPLSKARSAYLGARAGSTAGGYGGLGYGAYKGYTKGTKKKNGK